MTNPNQQSKFEPRDLDEVQKELALMPGVPQLISTFETLGSDFSGLDDDFVFSAFTIFDNEAGKEEEKKKRADEHGTTEFFEYDAYVANPKNFPTTQAKEKLVSELKKRFAGKEERVYFFNDFSQKKCYVIFQKSGGIVCEFEDIIAQEENDAPPENGFHTKEEVDTWINSIGGSSKVREKVGETQAQTLWAQMDIAPFSPPAGSKPQQRVLSYLLWEDDVMKKMHSMDFDKYQKRNIEAYVLPPIKDLQHEEARKQALNELKTEIEAETSPENFKDVLYKIEEWITTYKDYFIRGGSEFSREQFIPTLAIMEIITRSKWSWMFYFHFNEAENIKGPIYEVFKYINSYGNPTYIPKNLPEIPYRGNVDLEKLNKLTGDLIDLVHIESGYKYRPGYEHEEKHFSKFQEFLCQEIARRRNADPQK